MLLHALGFSVKKIRSVFFWQGAGIVLLGAVFGLVGGLLICIAQMKYGFVRINPSPIAPAYPVLIKTSDLLLIIGLVLLVGLTTVLLRVRALKVQDLYLLR